MSANGVEGKFLHRKIRHLIDNFGFWIDGNGVPCAQGVTTLDAVQRVEEVVKLAEKWLALKDAETAPPPAPTNPPTNRKTAIYGAGSVGCAHCPRRFGSETQREAHVNKEHVADAEDQSASALSKPLVRQKDGAIWSRERARKHEEQVKRAHEQDANRPKLPEIKPKGGRLLKKWKPNRSLSFRKQGAPVQQKPNFKPQKQAPTQQKKPLTNTKGAPTLPQGSTKPGTLERSELLDNSHRRLDGSKDYPQFREQGKFGSHSAYDAMDDESNP